MKQTIFVRLSKPNTIFVDTENVPRQEISGQSVKEVMVSRSVCNSIIGGSLIVEDLPLEDIIKHVLDFKRLDRKDLCKFCGMKFDDKIKTVELIEKAKEKVLDLMSSKAVSNQE